MNVVLKDKKEAPDPPKPKTKARLWKLKKVVLQGVHSHTHTKDPHITYILMTQDPASPKAAQISLKERPQEKQAWPLCHHQVPLNYWVSHEENRRQQHTVFIVDVKANKHQIKQAVKKLYDIDVAKINTLIRPDGQKKACVRLAPDYDALDVANKIGIIWVQPTINLNFFTIKKK